MQFCAILSQIHRHKDALEQAREGVRLGHLLINDLRELCLFYIRREDITVTAPPNNYMSSQTEQAYENIESKQYNSNMSFQGRKRTASS